MLSRFATRAVLSSCSSPIAVSQRFNSSEKAWYTERETTTSIAEDSDPSKVVASEIDDCVPKPTPFNGPLRDYVNFPKMKQMDKPVPSRLGMIPESWFKFLYPKIGVTGPYTLGIGIALFLIQKEIYLIDDYEFKHTVAFFMWMYVFIKTPLGLMIRDLVWDRSAGVDEALENLRKFNEELRVEAIAHEKDQQWRLEGKNLLFEAKKENVGLQLEASYRKCFMDVYKELKSCLDYQVEVAKIDQRIKQQFLVKWVLERVNESVGQTSEKENLKQCIANLNALVARV